MKVREEYEVVLCTSTEDVWIRMLFDASMTYRVWVAMWEVVAAKSPGVRKLAFLAAYRKSDALPSAFGWLLEKVDRVPELPLRMVRFKCLRLKEITDTVVLQKLCAMYQQRIFTPTGLRVLHGLHVSFCYPSDGAREMHRAKHLLHRLIGEASTNRSTLRHPFRWNFPPSIFFKGRHRPSESEAGFEVLFCTVTEYYWIHLLFDAAVAYQVKVALWEVTLQKCPLHKALALFAVFRNDDVTASAYGDLIESLDEIPALPLRVARFRCRAPEELSEELVLEMLQASYRDHTFEENPLCSRSELRIVPSLPSTNDRACTWARNLLLRLIDKASMIDTPLLSNFKQARVSPAPAIDREAETPSPELQQRLPLTPA